MGEKRPVNIGVFLDRVNTSYHEEVISGITDFAKIKKINLFVFITGWYNSISPWEKSENILFNYGKSNMLDGIIIFSSIGQIDSIEKLYSSIFPENKPSVVIGRNLENLPSVSVDNYNGISLLLNHLIKEHNYKKIAFLKGPDHNKEAQERLKAFLKIMEDNGIKVEPNWLIDGDFLIESGKKAAEFIVNKLNMNIDAIVCANDMMAFGIIDELKRRNFKVPDDLKIVGFDDINISDSYHLTTIHQPFYSIGYSAIKILIEKIENSNKNIEKMSISPSLIVRETCGCNTKNSEHLEKVNYEKNNIIKILKKYENLIPIDSFLEFFHKNDFSQEKFSTYLENEKSSMYVLKELACFIEKELPDISKIIKNHINERIFITDFEFKNNLLKINEIGENIISIENTEEKYDYIFRTFPDIGIDSTYLSFYEKSFSGIDFSKLIFAFDRYGKFKIPENGIRYLTYDILPVDFLPREESYQFFVYNLFHQENIGQIFFKIGELNLNLYEIIKNKIASSLSDIKTYNKTIETTLSIDNHIFIFLTDNSLKVKKFLIGETTMFKNFSSLLTDYEMKEIKSGIKKFRKLKIDNNTYYFLCQEIDDFLLWIILKEDYFNLEQGPDEIGIEMISMKYKLTEKEKQILKMLIKGLPNKEIAEKLFISENTVKNYTNKIYNKLEVKNRKELLSKIKNEIP
ncbi:MAG: substrate-binding domain-containing protein [Brevinematia bacterium]